MRVELEKDGWKAVIRPEFGGNVVKLTHWGNDILVPGEEEPSFLVGTPLLFPANRTDGGRFCFEGQSYHLPVNVPSENTNLHGSLSTAQFAVTHAGANEAELYYENTGEVYPFPFSLRLNYSVENGGFVQRFTFRNTGSKAMPFTFALHTSFVEPERFCAPIGMHQERNSRNLPTGRYLPLNEEQLSYVKGSASAGKIISGYFTAVGQEALIGEYRYTFSENFDHLVLYNGKGALGVLCVEPQCGAVNGLNIPGGHRILKPGEEMAFMTRLERLESGHKECLHSNE